jgi:hypothetical protein
LFTIGDDAEDAAHETSEWWSGIGAQSVARGDYSLKSKLRGTRRVKFDYASRATQHSISNRKSKID